MRDSQGLVFMILLMWVGEQELYARFCITSFMTLCVLVPQCFRFPLLRFGKFFILFSFLYYIWWYIFLRMCECVVLLYFILL